MDGRGHARDVGDVARADGLLGRVVAFGQRESPELAPVALGQGQVRPHGRRRGRDGLRVEAGAGRFGCAARAGQHARDRVVEFGRIERADPDLRRRPLGDDVRGLPAVGDDRVDADAARELLAQQPDRGHALHHPVERVHAALGVGRGVGRAAVEDEVVLGVAEEQAMGAPHVGGVGHHGRADPVEHAAFHESPLADAGLLGGAAHHEHVPRVLGQRLRQRRGRQQARRPREVVPARVPDLGQRIHLGQQRHREARPARSQEGRLHPRDARLDGKSARRQPRPIPLRGRELLHRKLGMRPHPASQRQRLVRLPRQRIQQRFPFPLDFTHES